MATKTIGGVLGFYSSSQCVYPVWKNSTRDEVKFTPLSKRSAVRLFHDARRFERRTRGRTSTTVKEKGRARTVISKQDGAIGRNGLALLQAMLFDCIDYVSGRLDPTYETLARLANISVRSVHRGLAKLKAAGVLDWIRRCHWNDDGTLEQDSNAYSVQPVDAWRGFFPPAPPPAAPLPGTWGDHPKTSDPLQLAAAAIARGDRDPIDGALTPRARAAVLDALDYETDPQSLAGALAKWARTREKNRDNGGRS